MANLRSTIPVPPLDWTPISNGLVSAMRFIVTGSDPILVLVTATNTKPTSDAGAVPYIPGGGERADVALQSLFPDIGAANAPGYVWVWSRYGSEVSVCHA